MTAVEWLKEKTSDNIIINRLNGKLSQWQDGYNVALEDVINLLSQAIEMEKQQIKDAYDSGYKDGDALLGYEYFDDSEKYYNETYKK